MRSFCLLVVCLFAGFACQSEPVAPLVVSDLDVKAPIGDRQMSAAYFTIANNSDSVVVITRVSSPQFGAVEMHESQLVDGISKMRQLSTIEVAAGSTEKFERGGKHLMLMRPAPGTFENGQPITFNFYSNDVLLLAVSATGGSQ